SRCRVVRVLLFSLFLLQLRPPPTSTLFPYTTLFRSQRRQRQDRERPRRLACARPIDQKDAGQDGEENRQRSRVRDKPPLRPFERSEEHTSELQSLRHLVCRLLLEKKKKHKQTNEVSL